MLGWISNVFQNGSNMSAQQTGTVGAVTGAGASGATGTTGLDLASQGVTDTGTVLDGPNGAGSVQGGPGFWSKDGGAGMILSGVQTLGSLWNSYQNHKIAKDQMNFAREQWSTNLANQTQTYNTALEDRIRARHHTEGKGASETNAYLDKHKL